MKISESHKNLFKLLDDAKIDDSKMRKFCAMIWDNSRASIAEEERLCRVESYKTSNKAHEVERLKTPDYVFVFRNIARTYVNNVAYGYFKKESLLIRNQDINSYYGTSAGFCDVELEQYVIEHLGKGRLPEKPFSLKNVYFCDDLVFLRDNLRFSFGDTGDCKEVDKILRRIDYGSYGDTYYSFLNKREAKTIDDLVEDLRERPTTYSYRFTGEPSYIPVRLALPPHERKYKQQIYHKEIDDRLDIFSIRERWEWCPIEIKIQMVKLWTKAKRAKRLGNDDLCEQLEGESKALFPYRVKKPSEINRMQWKQMSKIAQLNTTAGIINEYHQSS